MTFAKYVLNRFFAVAAQNNKAYVELLFWKNVGAVREMTEGYSNDGLVLIGSCVLVFVCCFVTIFFFCNIFYKLKSYQYLIWLIMSERRRDQHGLKRRKRSCVSCMKNTVILKVCLHLFCFIEAGRYCCTIVRSTFLCLLFACSVPDIVETLLPLLSNSTRTRRHVVTQLVHMGLVDNAKELKKQKYVFLKA